MSAKLTLVFCAQAVFARIVFSQCIRSGVENWGLTAPSVGITPCGSLGVHNLGFGEGFGFGCGRGIGADIGSGFVGFASGGGAFPIESLTPIPPKGIAVESENIYEGALGVVGELPFLSTVAFEGVLPSAGAGIVNHGCGNGITAITSEIDGSIGFNGAGGIGSGIIGAGGIGSGIIGAGGIAGASGIGTGAIGCAKPWKHSHWNGMGGHGCGCY